ncbi:MAG TPA: molybdenum ABC transporter ATP-binding protein [Blastocatellia bacterium]
MLSVDIKKSFEQPASAATQDAGTAPKQFDLDIHFTAPAGISILFGPSGSGKTSTLRCLAGIIRPDRGRILVSGSCLFDSEHGIDMRIRDRGVGYVFQNPSLFPHLTAQQNIEFGMTFPKSERRRRASVLMDAFRIAHTASRHPAQISGGEAQRVALARALAADPKFMLLDEPLSAIDETTKLGIIADLKTINAELKLPVVYVTHSQDEAIALGERLIVLDRGRVAALGEPLEVLAAPVSSGVARLTGVENIFDGHILARNDRAGFMSVQISDASGSSIVDVPLGTGAVGQHVKVALRAGDILLATEEPRHTSARNVLEARILTLEDKSDRVLVKALGGVCWTASLTRQAVEELGLASGVRIWLAFKTHSCYLLD